MPTNTMSFGPSTNVAAGATPIGALGALPRPTPRTVGGGAMSDAERSAQLARQYQPTVRPTGMGNTSEAENQAYLNPGMDYDPNSGSTSEAEFEAFRRSLPSKATDSPTERYLDYLKWFQKFGQGGASQNLQQRAKANEMSPTGSTSIPIQAPMATPPRVSSPMNVVPGASDVQSLDDFMSNINRKAQFDSTPYLGRT